MPDRSQNPIAIRRRIAADNGERIANEALTLFPDFELALQSVTDYILTETDGETIDGRNVTGTMRLAAYHAILAKVARIIGE